MFYTDKETLDVIRNWDAYCAGEWIPEWKKSIENPKEIEELNDWAKKGIDISGIENTLGIKQEEITYYIG